MPTGTRSRLWTWRPRRRRLAPIDGSYGIVTPLGATWHDIWDVAANAAPWELYMCVSDELRDEVDADPDKYIELYGEWKYDYKAWLASLPDKNKKGGKQASQ
jgi:hypothetical protein